MRPLRTIFLSLLAMLPAAVCCGDTVLYDFYADWCGPCRQMTATVDVLVAEGYTVQRINIDQNRALAKRFGVSSIPCFVAVENGNEIDRIVGKTSVERLKLKLHREKRQPAKAEPRRDSERQPHPAWRYETPVGHRAAVVRVYCQDDVRTRSLGSGTLVRWGTEKIVVLTARHVIEDAQQIVVRTVKGAEFICTPIAVDAVWDCAVLRLNIEAGKLQATVQELSGLAVDVELGAASMPKKGDRLETCGYGPDGKLASNYGLMLGWRGTAKDSEYWDWLGVSGHARGGDSGGPIFNERGKLVGVLWGSNAPSGPTNNKPGVMVAGGGEDGPEVTGVDAGRIHRLLSSAAQSFAGPTSIQQRSVYDLEGNAKTMRLLSQRAEGRQTPPMDIADLPQATSPACDPSTGCCPVPGPIFDSPVQPAAAGKAAKPVLPWRGGELKRDDDLARRQQELLAALEAERQARLAAERQQAPPPVESNEQHDAKSDEVSPLLAGLCILGAIACGFVVYFVGAKN
jgi:thioredoxin 1